MVMGSSGGPFEKPQGMVIAGSPVMFPRNMFPSLRNVILWSRPTRFNGRLGVDCAFPGAATGGMINLSGLGGSGEWCQEVAAVEAFPEIVCLRPSLGRAPRSRLCGGSRLRPREEARFPEETVQAADRHRHAREERRDGGKALRPPR